MCSPRAWTTWEAICALVAEEAGVLTVILIVIVPIVLATLILLNEQRGSDDW